MSNGDKRSVATDALETLGNVIDSSQKRDAIHIAVEPIQAAEILAPCDHVGIVNGKATKYVKAAELIGIVDPFIKGCVRDGEWFWLMVYPRQITSLRHVWSHPKFAEADVFKEEIVQPEIKSYSEKDKISDFASGLGLSYYELLEAAKDYIRDGDYINVGELEGLDLPEGFWDHFVEVTGVEVPSSNRYSFFNCAC